jgi:hypothetical protein
MNVSDSYYSRLVKRYERMGTETVEVMRFGISRMKDCVDLHQALERFKREYHGLLRVTKKKKWQGKNIPLMYCSDCFAESHQLSDGSFICQKCGTLCYRQYIHNFNRIEFETVEVVVKITRLV